MTALMPAHLRSGGGWALASVAAALSAGLVRTVVVARWLEPVEIGVMGVALLALGFVEAVASTGVDTALVAERNDVERYFDPAFTIQVIRGLAVATLLWAAAPALAWAFQDAAASGVIRAVATIAAIRGFANPAVALAVRRLEFRRVFWWSVPEALVSLCLTVGLAILRRDVWALVIGTIAGQIVGTVASYGLVPRAPRLSRARPAMAELLRVGRLVSGSRALMYFSVNLDAAVVGVALGTHALGLYQFATRVAELPVVTFTRAMAQVALPALSALRTDRARLTHTWKGLLGSVLAVNAAAAILILLFARVGVLAVAGEQWAPAIPLIQILAIAMLFRAVVVLTGQLLDAIGRPAWTLRLNAARLAALAAVLPPAALWIGLHGVAYAALLVSGGVALLAARMSARVVAGVSDAADA